MYEYYYVMTMAQIELLTIDVPMVVYKKEPKRDKNGKIIPKKANPVDVARAAARYEAKYKKSVENKHSFDFSGYMTTEQNSVAP